MELRDLKSFVEVADHKSFTQAAEHSFLTQPSLSKAVKKLEDELNVELFDRSTRHLYLTDAGRIVYQQSQKAFHALSEMNIYLDDLRNIAIGDIKVGIPPLIGTLFFPEIARKFNQQYPKVSLELIELGAVVISQLVEDSQVDVGVVVLPANEEKLNVHPFIQDEFYLFIHKDHKLAQKNSITLDELKNEKFILFQKDFSLHEYIIQACVKQGFTPTVSYQSSQWDLIIELVASQLGIALLPKSVYLKQNNENIKIVRIENPTLYWNLGIITKKNAYHSFALREFVKTLIERIE